jgi:hypothetical protein
MPDWLHEGLRLYQIIKLTGWTLAEIERTPAVLLDVLLELDNAAEEARNRTE